MRNEVFERFLMDEYYVELVRAKDNSIRGGCVECAFFDYSNHFTPYALRNTEQCLACEAVRKRCINESLKQKAILVWKMRKTDAYLAREKLSLNE